jgi:hypothetical protein
MNSLRFAAGSVVALLSVLAVTNVTACGEDVATCDSACAAAGYQTNPQGFGTTPPISNAFGCVSACDASQASASLAGHGADFQALLTCVDNAGGLSPLCDNLACGVTTALGAPSSCNVSTSGDSSTSDDAGLLSIQDSSTTVVGQDATTVIVVAVDASSATDASCSVACEAPCENDPNCIQLCGC